MWKLLFRKNHVGNKENCDGTMSEGKNIKLCKPKFFFLDRPSFS